MRATTGERGFTLLEVLVALVLLATVAVAVLQVFGGGARLVRASGDHLGATMVAGAKLDEIGPGPLEAGTTAGSEGSYRWTRRVTFDVAAPPFEPGSPEAARVRLAQVTVAVQWGRAGRLELSTLRAWSALP